MILILSFLSSLDETKLINETPCDFKLKFLLLHCHNLVKILQNCDLPTLSIIHSLILHCQFFISSSIYQIRIWKFLLPLFFVLQHCFIHFLFHLKIQKICPTALYICSNGPNDFPFLKILHQLHLRTNHNLSLNSILNPNFKFILFCLSFFQFLFFFYFFDI